jgi:hypothetical protein
VTPGDNFAKDLAAFIDDPELKRRVRDAEQGDELNGLHELYVRARALLGADDESPAFPLGFVGCLKMLLQLAGPGASFAKAARCLDSYSSGQFSNVRVMLLFLGQWVLVLAAALAGREPYIIDASMVDSAWFLLARRIFDVAAFEPGESVLPALITTADQWEDDSVSDDVKVKGLEEAIKVLAAAGADFREVMTAPPDWLMMFGPRDDLHSIQDELIRFSDDAIRVYHESDDPVRRRAMARIACSVNRFPELLERCVRSDATSGSSGEFDELISYLTPYWAKQYWREIERSGVTVARNQRLPDDAANSVLARLSSRKAAARPDAKS